jgi:dihydrofolate reductase
MSARVVYSFNVSLDGYINSSSGSLEWGGVDEELHAWFNDRARESSADIYGRRLYETMAAHWPFALDDPDSSPVEQDFARIWNATPKIVFSRTLETAPFAQRLMRTDIVDEIAGLKNEFDGEIGVGGAMLANSLVARDLIDEYRLIVHPVVIGGGTPFFPPGVQLSLRLTETHHFGNGAFLLRYERR